MQYTKLKPVHMLSQQIHLLLQIKNAEPKLRTARYLTPRRASLGAV